MIQYCNISVLQYYNISVLQYCNALISQDYGNQLFFPIMILQLVARQTK